MLNTNRKHIVYFHQDALITGSLISLKNLILALDQTRFKATVILPLSGDAVKFLEQDGIHVLIFPYKTFWTSPGPRCFSRDNARQLAALIPNGKLAAFVKQLQPDLIHLNDKAVINVGISCKKLGIPIIQHSRSAYYLTACKLNKIISSWLIRKNANHIICISEDEEETFELIKQKDIIFNSVNQELCNQAINKRDKYRANLGLSEKQVAICVAENLGVNKGLFDIVNLAKKILVEQEMKHVKFIIAGKISQNDSLIKYGFNGSCTEYLNSFIEQHQLQNQFTILGFRSDVLSVIAACDLIMISKAHGVLGRQPIEAQSVGIPVVAINGKSGRSTIVKNEQSGYLCDNLFELEEKIVELIINTDKRKKFGLAGLKHAKKAFNPLENIKRIENIYQLYLKP